MLLIGTKPISKTKGNRDVSFFLSPFNFHRPRYSRPSVNPSIIKSHSHNGRTIWKNTEEGRTVILTPTEYARGIKKKKKNVWKTKNDGITTLSSAGWGILYREFMSDTGWHLCVKPIGTGGNEKFQTRFAPQPAPSLIRRVSTLGIYYADLPRADVPRKNSVTPIQAKCFEANDTNFHASTCPNEAFNPLLLRRFPNQLGSANSIPVVRSASCLFHTLLVRAKFSAIVFMMNEQSGIFLSSECKESGRNINFV